MHYFNSKTTIKQFYTENNTILLRCGVLLKLLIALKKFLREQMSSKLGSSKYFIYIHWREYNQVCNREQQKLQERRASN